MPAMTDVISDNSPMHAPAILANNVNLDTAEYGRVTRQQESEWNVRQVYDGQRVVAASK